MFGPLRHLCFVRGPLPCRRCDLTLKSRHGSHRFDSPSFSLSLSLSGDFFSSFFSFSRSWFIVPPIHLFYHSKTHRMCNQTCASNILSRMVEIAYELIKLYIIYSAYTNAIENICRSLNTLTAY